MDKWLGIAIPIIVSFISAVFTGIYIAGRNIERLKMFEQMQATHNDEILELMERVSKIEGALEQTK